MTDDTVNDVMLLLAAIIAAGFLWQFIRGH